LVVLIPHYFFLSQSSDPSDYQARFREFADASGCHVYDLLPDLLQGTAEERGALWSDAEGHLSANGHQTLARLLAPRLQGLLGG
jgi:lysophospholipase L1-like esterase